MLKMISYSLDSNSSYVNKLFCQCWTICEMCNILLTFHKTYNSDDEGWNFIFTCETYISSKKPLTLIERYGGLVSNSTGVDGVLLQTRTGLQAVTCPLLDHDSIPSNATILAPRLTRSMKMNTKYGTDQVCLFWKPYALNWHLIFPLLRNFTWYGACCYCSYYIY